MKGEFMAKRKDTTTASDQTTRGSATPAADTVEQRLVAFAEQLGRIIGTVQARADGWLDRRALDEELTRIRDGAADLLDHLGSGEAASSVAATPGQRQTKDHTPGRSAKTTAGRRATAETGRSGGTTAETGRSGGTTAATGRSGGKVDAPGKTHRRPPAGGRGIKHSDEMIPKLKAAQAMRRRRHG